MKRKHIITSIIFCMAQNLLLAQSNGQMLESIPKEVVFVHYNGSTLFTGEKLLYKFYALDNTTQKPTKISKIGYVSLIDKNGSTVFSHKLRLDSGSGYGDFFLPVDLFTGAYKLFGYTEWMKNFGTESFFQADVFIINPYKALPDAHLEKHKDSILNNSASEVKSLNDISQITDSPFINVAMDKKVAGKRERVTVSIVGTDDNSFGGNYSISVKKKDSVSFGSPSSSDGFYTSLNKNRNKTRTSGKFHIPEIRGEVISGTILERGSLRPAENQKLALSLPGEAYWLKIATSDPDGRFSFILDRNYDNTEAALQLIYDSVDLFDVTMDTKDVHYENLVFPEFTIPRFMKNAILKRSIHNQIENAYSEVRSDSLVNSREMPPFYRKFQITYDLDAYTRFNTLEETIIEVADHLSLKMLPDGSKVFEVRPNEGLPKDNLFAAVFVDGLFIENHGDFIDYSAKKIKSINFLRDDVMIGSQAFQGVILFETIEGEFFNEFYTPDLMRIGLFKPEVQKHYFNQKYSINNIQQRIPDYRYQLLWLPNLELSQQTTEIVFYTSDVSGNYDIILEGFTSTGKPVSVKRRLVVH